MPNELDAVRFPKDSGAPYAGHYMPSAWPGMYPLVYVTRDGLNVCHACADRDVDDAQEIVAWVVLEEGEVTCDDCGATLGAS